MLRPIALVETGRDNENRRVVKISEEKAFVGWNKGQGIRNREEKKGGEAPSDRQQH